jgi:hypothetical protein
VGRPHPAAWAGVAFAVLFLVGFFMLQDVPGAKASEQELEEFYTSSDRTVVVIASLYVVPFAGIAFMWFLAALRQRVAHASAREDPLFSTVQLLSGVLFIAMFFIAAAARAAPALAIEVGDAELPEGSRELLAFGQATLMVFALRCAGVFMITGTVRAVRADLAPIWFRVVSLIGALVLIFSASYVIGLILLFPIWVGTISLFVLFRLRAQRVAAEA